MKYEKKTEILCSIAKSQVPSPNLTQFGWHIPYFHFLQPPAGIVVLGFQRKLKFGMAVPSDPIRSKMEVLFVSPPSPLPPTMHYGGGRGNLGPPHYA